MTADVLVVAVLAGAANWAFRVLPTRARTERLPQGDWLPRFLASTGPAAIATLFVAAILPAILVPGAALGPVVVGVLAVLLVFAATRAVVWATLAGAVAHGLAVWALSVAVT